MGLRWVGWASGLFLVQAGMACRGSAPLPSTRGSGDQPALSLSENAAARSEASSARAAISSGSAGAKGVTTPPAADPTTTVPPGMVDVVHGPMNELPARTAALSGPACRSFLARAAASARAAHIANGRCQADSECVASQTGACIGGCYTAVAKARRKEQEQALGDINDKLCGPLWAGDCAKHLPAIPVPTCAAPVPKCENGICEARF